MKTEAEQFEAQAVALLREAAEKLRTAVAFRKATLREAEAAVDADAERAFNRLPRIDLEDAYAAADDAATSTECWLDDVDDLIDRMNS